MVEIRDEFELRVVQRRSLITVQGNFRVGTNIPAWPAVCSGCKRYFLDSLMIYSHLETLSMYALYSLGNVFNKCSSSASVCL